MTDAPKRIAFRKKYMSDAITNGPLMDDPNYIHYIRADLSADLVRAGYLVGLEVAANKMCHPSNLNDLGGYGSPMRAAKGDRDAILAMSPNERAIAAIVAQVMEGGE